MLQAGEALLDMWKHLQWVCREGFRVEGLGRVHSSWGAVKEFRL